MAERGRPLKLTKEVQENIVLMLKLGNYIEAAAPFAGVTKKSIYNWMERGRREEDRVNAAKGRKIRKAEKPFVDFLHAVEKAMAESEIRDVQVLYSAAKKDPKWAAWRLERKYPDRWGRKDKHEVTGKDGGPIEVEDPKEKLLQKLNEMAARKEQDE